MHNLSHCESQCIYRETRTAQFADFLVFSTIAYQLPIHNLEVTSLLYSGLDLYILLRMR